MKALNVVELVLLSSASGMTNVDDRRFSVTVKVDLKGRGGNGKRLKGRTTCREY